MQDRTISGIRDYIQLSERIATSGQPTEGELAAVAQAGYEVVINLDQSASDYALDDEGGLVRSLGMEYVHIPVVWENPTRANLECFCEAMEVRREKKLFVHCVANRRVSVFMALYRILKLGWEVQEARQLTFLDTMPEHWHAFFDELLQGRQEA
jgi:protein tyrosine phosphatase (PTP) superfamily phosphohydrolase (DUF442 family)